MDIDEKRALDYEQALQTYRQFADLRFKLLAFVPAIAGAAIALLTKAELEPSEKVALAIVGFLVTFGIVVYDQRNTRFYNGAITRAQHLERQLRLETFGGDLDPGLFGSRRGGPKSPPPRRLLGLRVGHDLGLALVYSPVLGAWVFLAVRAWPARSWIALAAGLAVTVAFFAQFEWNDGKPERLRNWWCERRQARTKEATLRQRNEDTFRAESRQSIDGEPWNAFLESVLTDDFVLRRSVPHTADESREELISRIGSTASGVERHVLPESIRVWVSGRLGAVTSVVTIEAPNGTRAFQNVKLFVEPRRGWRCAYWQVTERPFGGAESAPPATQ